MTEFAERLAHLDRVVKYGRQVLELACSGPVPNSVTPPLALGLLARTLEHARAIRILLLNNNPVEARVICRCCLENCFVAAAIAKKGEAFATTILHAAGVSARKTLDEAQRQARGKGRKTENSFEKQLRDLLQGIRETGSKSRLNLKESADAGQIGLLYSIYRTLSEDSAHPSFSSINRHAEGSPGSDGSWKIIVSEEPNADEAERCDTLDTAALAILGVAVSVRTVREVSALVSEIEEIRNSHAKIQAKYSSDRSPVA